MDAASTSYLDSPLHRAARYDQVEEVRRLLKETPTIINVTGFNGRTALHQAVASNSKSCIQVLLENGVDINCSDKEGRTAIHYAILYGHVGALELLLSNKMALVDARDKNGITPIILACQKNKPDCISLLISRGADVTMCDKDGKDLVDICRESNTKVPRILNDMLTKKKKEQKMNTREIETYKGAQIFKTGILFKRGGGKVSTTWKERFFVLTKKPELFYFEKVTSSNWKEKKPKGTIPILNHKIEECVDKDRSNAFKLVPNDMTMRIWYISANSSTEMNEWINILKIAQTPHMFMLISSEADKDLGRFYINPSDLEIQEKQIVGAGGVGVIYKGIWLGGTEVAVKSLKGEDVDEESANLFIQEIRTISDLRHANIVSMYGYTIKDNKLCLVTEYINGGDLSAYIFNPNCIIDDILKIKLALSICRGMTYLHSKKIIHRDLKPQNVLVENLEDAKLRVCDFGLSIVVKSKVTEALHTSPVYEAPELSFNSYDHKVDIYSFAILLWELDQRAYAWEDFTFITDIFRRVQKGERPPLNPESIFSKIISICWDQTPQKRPEFRMLSEDLNSLMTQSLTSARLKLLSLLDKNKTPEENILSYFEKQSEIPWSELVNLACALFNTRPELFNNLQYILLYNYIQPKKTFITKETWQNFLKWFSPLRFNDGYSLESRIKDDPGNAWAIEDIYEICCHSWFFGFIPVEKCTEILNKKPVGTYMLRFSRDSPWYTLSVATSTRVMHWRIQCIKQSGLVIFKTGAKEFKSIPELFEYHSSVPLFQDNQSILLTNPCKRELS